MVDLQFGRQSEPLLTEISDGSTINMVLEVVIQCPKANICRSVISQQLIMTDVDIPANCSRFTVLRGEKHSSSHHVWLKRTEATVVFGHYNKDVGDFGRIVELCSGIGAVDKGYHFCGATTTCYVDSNPVFCEWLSKRNIGPVVCGNITDDNTIADIAKLLQQGHILSSGVSCQPFSKLGDQKENLDSRSESFTSTLKAAYLLQSPAVILECTPTAMESSWAQGMIQSFAQCTGFRMQQKVVSLHKSWPGRRDRWWCVLSHPQLPAFAIHDLPELRFAPTIAHLIPSMLKVPNDHPDEIELGENEYSQLLTFPRTDSFLINVHAGLPTATHSWGSQLVGCQCKCRKFGFATKRLQSKGLYAVLTTTGDMMQVNGQEMPRLRHLLAQEVALLNGLPPSYVTPVKDCHLRLDLAATGQLASPLQSGWLLGCIYHQLEQQGLARDTVHPRHLFANMCRALFQERDSLWQIEKYNKYMEIYHKEIESIDCPRIYPKNDDQEEEIASQALQQACAIAELELAKINADDPQNQHKHKGKGGTIPQHGKVHRVGNGDEHFVPPTDLGQQTAQVHTNKGGIPGFESSKRNFEKQEPPEKRHCSGKVPIAEQTDSRVETANPSPDESTQCEPIEPVTPPLEPIERREAPVNVGVSTSGNKTLISAEPSAVPSEHLHKQEDQHMEAKVENKVENPEQSCWIIHAEESMHQIRFRGKPTVGQLEQAEAYVSDEQNAFRSTTGVGHKIPISSEIQDQQIVVPNKDINAVYRCPLHHETKIPRVEGLPRIIALWSQRGWVASDEMNFYLRNMQNTKMVRVVDAFILSEPQPIDAGAQFKEKVEQIIIDHQDHANQVLTAVFFANHWSPLSISWDHDNVLQFSTSHEMQTVIQEWTQHFCEETQCTTTAVTVPQVFDADCGFQTVAWILKQIEPGQNQFPMQPDTAQNLREAFVVHLGDADIAGEIFRGHVLGGMNNDAQLKLDLQMLLENHGVHPKRSMECRDNLVTSLGMPTIKNVLGSARPWKDLKTRASEHRPPIQIVLADELKTMVDARIANGKQLGKKTQKKNQKPNNVPLKIDADKIMLPPAIFQQSDGTQLHQITTRQFGPRCRGVAVVNIEEATAFFQLKEPISKEGVAMLILDLNDERIPPHSKISFPATCPGTEEPVLLTAALVQLGNQQVTRVVPSDRIRIQESHTEVIRVSVYRDQFAGDWSDFANKPVRAILAHEVFGSFDKDGVVDVWDRQFLSKQYQKRQTLDAEIFVVTFPLMKPNVAQLQLQSGQHGMYFEPRSECGRTPMSGFQVIWLPRKQLSEVIVACQVLPHPGWVVRHGDRYGVRVLNDHAQKTHEMHRPDICYLGGQTMQTYKIGPLPFGTTRKSLVSLFEQWQWTARPGQPIGQSQNHQGVFWTVQACQAPSHWVFNMEHGDILIALHTSPKEHSKPSQGLLVASKRTLEAIATSSGSSQANDKAQPEPLRDDPWQTYRNNQKGVSVSQLAAIESNVQQRVMASLQNKTSEDENMEGVVDTRVSQLETQVKQLTENFQNLSGSVSTFQQQQSHVNSQIANQITGVKTQMDKQNVQMQQILDSKMEEQMSRIEALLMKRHKSQE